MSPQRYQQVSSEDSEVPPTDPSIITPSSPPPSFRSRASSPSRARLLQDDPYPSQADQALADSFDHPSDDDGLESGDEEGGDDRQRFVHRTNRETEAFPDVQTGSVLGGGDQRGGIDADRPYVTRRPPTSTQRRMTELPRTAHTPPVGSNGIVYGGGSASNDGVFANLDAKPERGEKAEEQPPSYEQAAADATPPYWETTILAPGVGPDEVFIDGLPVGSVFSFVWNAMISMSFQLVGFLLTYLLHTTHAAKNGSKAGLGITLVQYGFYMKGSKGSLGGGGEGSNDGPSSGPPSDANSHDFDPSAMTGNAALAVAAMADASNGNSSPSSRAALSSITTGDWLAYVLMVVGWFILIRAVSNFLKARRHEQLVLQSPDRGLNVPIVATGEPAETAV